MKSTFYTSCLALLAMSAPAAMPAFEKGTRIKVGGEDIDFRVGHNVPVVADWNSDGKKDLIVGHFTGNDGNIKLFLNEGTDAAPVFKKRAPLTAGGKPIRMSGG